MSPGQEVHAPADLFAREWLLADGLGGSASGTAAGVRTRRTHALLTACSAHGRLHALLLGVDERLTVDALRYDLASHHTESGQLRPAGYRLIESFRLDPWPVWRFRAGGVVIEKSLFLLHRHAAVVIGWRLIEGDDARLFLTPLTAARDPYALQRESDAATATTRGIPGRVRLERGPDRPPLVIWHNAAFLPARVWKRGLAFPLDRAAESSEDAFVPGYLDATLTAGKPVWLVASCEPDLFRSLAAEERLGAPPGRSLAECVAVLERFERERHERACRSTIAGADFTARQAAVAHGGPGEQAARRPEPMVDAADPFAARLGLALRAGLARRGGRLTVVSSLPGTAERPAEALRAVAGLVSLRAFDAAREVVRGAIEWLDEGLVPERFRSEDGTPVHGDPLPSLWLVYAADLYARRSGEGELLADVLFPALESVMQFYRSGTRHGIRVDSDGLLVTGEGEWAAKRADANALWYHALVAMAQLARLIGRKEGGAYYLAWAREHQLRFLATMWDEEHGCLYEAVGAEGPRPGLSPGQVLAASLPPALLPPERASRLLDTVEQRLLTPWGLREAADSERVSTAWLGPFIGAWLRTRARDAIAQQRARDGIAAAVAAGPAEGQVPDALRVSADGRSVSLAGDPASPLAAAELLRAWIEELDRPYAMRAPDEPAFTPGT